jgi:multidrug resistance protein MdtO
MGLFALVYAFPNVDGLGGFWLVFAAGTAVAAWINFGTPRVSYGGYQTGLTFYKAVFQGFGPAVSPTVLRDRLLGVALGLIVFGLLEHVLWPVRAADRMRERLADVFRSLAALALACANPGGLRPAEVDAQRRLISQQVADVQGFIESSKFELDGGSARATAQLLGDAQTVFLVLLAIARHEGVLPASSRAALLRLPRDGSAALEALAEHLRRGGDMPTIDLGDTLATAGRDITADGSLEDDPDPGIHVLYREFVVAVNRLVADGRRASRV